MFRRLCGILLCGTALSGCAVHEVHKDHDRIRTTLLDLYTNQIMDNLVRTANRMPIIQLDYNNAATQVTITTGLGGNDSPVTTASNVLAIPAASLSATRTIMTTLMGSASNMNANQVSLTATPLTTSNEVYDAYVKFVNSGNLIVSPVEPPPGAAHICRKVGCQFYYVPVDHRDEFFKLALVTTAQWGTNVQSTDIFWTVTLKAPKNSQENPIPGTGKILIFNIEKQKIPEGEGYLVLDSDLTGIQFGIKTRLIPPSTDPMTASEAHTLVIYVPNETIDLRLDKDEKNRPDGGKNLFYVSMPNNGTILHFRTYDSNGKPFKEINEDDPSLNSKATTIALLKGRLAQSNWAYIEKEKYLNIRDIALICDYPINLKQDLFEPLPKKAKIYLEGQSPKPPKTDQPIRTDSLLQSILFNQNRLAP